MLGRHKAEIGNERQQKTRMAADRRALAPKDGSPRFVPAAGGRGKVSRERPNGSGNHRAIVSIVTSCHKMATAAPLETRSRVTQRQQPPELSLPVTGSHGQPVN